VEVIVTRLAVAALLTALIGADRELRAKPAGLRTNMVVGTATAAFAFIGAEVITGEMADPGRVAAQVVSGIGFLGGGAIFAAGGKPSGLTTAAALWGSAAIGLAAGIGAYGVAVALVVVLLIALWPLDILVERALQRRGRHDVHAQVVLDDLASYAAIRDLIRARRVRVVGLTLGEIGGRPVADLRLSGSAQVIAEALGGLEAAPGVMLVAHDSVSRMDD